MTQQSQMQRGQGSRVANPFAGQMQQGGPQRAMAQAQASRSLGEVQAQVILAKQYPRDTHAAFDRIMTACERPSLAEQAEYRYPRGGQTVSGPSIRLAEALARNWGNMEFGVREVERRNGESVVEAFCWDLETNTRSSKVFAVPHERKAHGSIKALEEPQDIYEATANQAARRMRACILAVIPGDVVDAALDQCRKTLQRGLDSGPLEDKIRAMYRAFSAHGVEKDALESYLGHPLKQTTPEEFADLRSVYNAIKDNYQAREDFFPDYYGDGSSNKGDSKASSKQPKNPYADADGSGGEGSSPAEPKEPQKAPEPKAEPAPKPDQQEPKQASLEEPEPDEPTDAERRTKAKQSMGALIGKCEGIGKEEREAFYEAIAIRNGFDSLDETPPGVLEGMADTLSKKSSKENDEGSSARSLFIEQYSDVE